jgi:CHRD domain-containing protein
MMKYRGPANFARALMTILMSVAVFIASCGGSSGGNAGPVPPTPTPIGTAARLVSITTSMPTPTTVFGGTGTATGKLAVNMDTGDLGGAILFSGLSGTVLAASIRDSTADPASLASLVVSLESVTTGAWVVPANTVLNQLQLSALQTGVLYFRLDTQSNQLGDKRGAIVFPNLTITTPLTPVAGTGSTGAGTGTLTVNLGTGTISGSITFSGLTSNATAAHIHLRSDNSSIITLEGGGATAGTFTFPAGAFLNAPQLRALTNDGLYFTVNSQNFQLPVSELIGNIVYPVTIVPNVSLSGLQEVPPVNTVGSGTGSLTVSLGTGKISGSVTFNTPSSISDRADINQGFTGENGLFLIALQGGAPSTSGTWTIPANTFLSAERLGFLISDRLYLNVHTAGHTDGEIRGQIRKVPTN